jgi:hypothetical protein
VSILVFGQDLDDYSSNSKYLRRELVRAGFRTSELESVSDPRDIRGYGECHVITFGAGAFSEVTGLAGLSKGRGMLHSSQWSDGALVFPTFSPGYLLRKPHLIWQFRDDLQRLLIFINLDLKGEVA